MATRVIGAEARITAKDATRAGLNSAARGFDALAARIDRINRMSARASARLQDVGRVGMATAAGLGAVGAVAAYRAAAAYDRRLTMIGQTADATHEEIEGLGRSLATLGQETATPLDQLTGGLEALVAQGRSLQEGLEFLPSVARTAAATGSAVDDIAKTADSVGSNFKVAGREMQAAFDIMAAGGKAGQFELKDMARYLPSLGPATAAIGFAGTKGLADLVAMLQVMRKGSGTAEEAVASMTNVINKMESDKTIKGFRSMGVDAEKAFAKARKEGRNLVEVFEELLQQATKGDRSKIGEIIDDQEFKRGALALMSFRGEWQQLSRALQSTSGGTVMRDLVGVTKDAQAAIDRLGNSWTAFFTSAAKAADSAGASRGLGVIGRDLETLAGIMDRLNEAYDKAGWLGILKQAGSDIQDHREATYRGQTSERQARQLADQDAKILQIETRRAAAETNLKAAGFGPEEIARRLQKLDGELTLAREGLVALRANRAASETPRDRELTRISERLAAERNYVAPPDEWNRRGHFPRGASVQPPRRPAEIGPDFYKLPEGPYGAIRPGATSFGFGAHGVPVDVTGKVEADVTGRIETYHGLEITASPDFVARITKMVAKSTGPIDARAGTSMPAASGRVAPRTLGTGGE